MKTRPTELRFPRPDGKKDIVRIPAGLDCTIDFPSHRKDNGKKLMQSYVEVTLAEPFPALRPHSSDGRTFYTAQIPQAS